MATIKSIYRRKHRFLRRQLSFKTQWLGQNGSNNCGVKLLKNQVNFPVSSFIVNEFKILKFIEYTILRQYWWRRWLYSLSYWYISVNFHQQSLNRISSAFSAKDCAFRVRQRILEICNKDTDYRYRSMWYFHHKF